MRLKRQLKELSNVKHFLMDITTRYPSHESCQKKRYQIRKSCLIYNTSQITSCLRYRTTIRFVFFIHSLWSVGTTLISDTTQNPELSGFQLRMRIKTTKRKAKIEQRQNKITFLWLIQQSTCAICVQLKT